MGTLGTDHPAQEAAILSGGNDSRKLDNPMAC
jgi:hypothetical protein